MGGQDGEPLGSQPVLQLAHQHSRVGRLLLLVVQDGVEALDVLEHVLAVEDGGAVRADVVLSVECCVFYEHLLPYT